jgi:hypothetical protein
MKRSTGRIGLLVALVIGIGLLTLVGWGVSCRGFAFAKKGTPTLAKLERNTGCRFPKSTRMIGGYYESWIEYDYLAVLKFDAKDTGAFMKSIPQKVDEKTGTLISESDRLGINNTISPAITANGLHWWNPDSAKKIIAVKIEGRRPAYLLISLDDPKTTRVYVYAYSS